MTILVAVDVEHAPADPIAVGYDLATTYDDRLVVLYVMPEAEYDRRQDSREELPEDVESGGFTLEQAQQAATQQVREAVDDVLASYDVDRVEPVGQVGSPEETILEATDRVDPRFVVVGGRKRSPARQALFGSVSQTVMRETEQPVVTIMEETE